MRELFVTELVKDLLGPRNGPYEIMNHSPLSEYITGVLSPVDAVPEITDGEPVNIPSPELTEDEDQEQDIQIPPLLSPVLDPQSIPPSFGISFAVEADKTPEAEICLTWAKYERTGDGDTVCWKRKPRYTILTLPLDEQRILYFDNKGKQTSPRNAEISFHVVVRNLSGRKKLVNLYFVNRTAVSSDGKAGVEHHIFQPQIRVVLKEGTGMISADILQGEDEESRELAFLYRNRPVMGRGFLCSVVWRDIDPQRSYSGKPDFSWCCKEPPFGWPDGEIIPHQYRDKFRYPDIRSEFIPLYSIPFPDMEWSASWGNPPELRADILAETYNSDVLEEALSPLVKSYEQWVQSLNNNISGLSSPEQQIARKIMQRCEEALRRMKAGLDLLIRDDEVRLAFCFANKAMDLQAHWSHRGPLRWRLFQLGYILIALESLANQNSGDRNVCDLLWVPTGAGKTEAYLFLIIFTLALRRRRARINNRKVSGTAVITRYTLRLLTIQQFRRLLKAITASEYLRVDGLGESVRVGWRPLNCKVSGKFIWGSEPFSTGLWVGGGVTPNRLRDTWGGNRNIPGALSILKGKQGEGEPAQVVTCPACDCYLAIPAEGISGSVTLHLVIKTSANVIRNALQHWTSRLSGRRFNVITIRSARLTQHSSTDFYTLSLELDINGKATSRNIESLWNEIRHNNLQGTTLMSARASRPGYFIRWYSNQRGNSVEYDFEIFCPNPECPLHRPWCAGAPLGWIHGTSPHPDSPTGGIQNISALRDGNRFVQVQNAFRYNGHPYISDRIPIPALTVDEQIYHRIPSVVVATVDKFARPPFEPHASGIFGNVNYYHCVWGYYRKGNPPASAPSRSGHPDPAGRSRRRNYIRISPPDPPELIIQDELHLIDGPLGSLVGFYETAVGYLCEENRKHVKYIASTATIRNAQEQVRNVFVRKLFVFPPSGLTADDRFFIRERENHPLEDGPPGRLYLGVCAPGRGPLTPQIRIYARLLQIAEDIRKNYPDMNVDSYWTLTGYFNAIRELGGARALYRQDIPERLMQIAGNRARQIPDDRVVELSSRTDSTSLPAILDLLSHPYPEAPDFLFTTSMFGTGVDIPRISLMVVNGQPKTTSSYIQATGRVGRQRGALVVTFFRATRPRDLSHYEFFCGYHRQLHRYVEPLSVYPFAPGVLERAMGAVCVFILRNMRNTRNQWHEEGTGAQLMVSQRNAPEVQLLTSILDNRNRGQNPVKQHRNLKGILNSELDRWRNVAGLLSNLRYVEYAFTRSPQYPVVLGDPAHRHAGLDVVYENVPQSLRDIEETCGFET